MIENIEYLLGSLRMWFSHYKVCVNLTIPLKRWNDLDVVEETVLIVWNYYFSKFALLNKQTFDSWQNKWNRLLKHSWRNFASINLVMIKAKFCFSSMCIIVREFLNILDFFNWLFTNPTSPTDSLWKYGLTPLKARF